MEFANDHSMGVEVAAHRPITGYVRIWADDFAVLRVNRSEDGEGIYELIHYHDVTSISFRNVDNGTAASISE